MNKLFFATVLTTGLLLSACPNWPGEKTGYVARLPELPAHWTEVLGEAHWQLRWFDPLGERKQAVLMPGTVRFGIELAPDLPSPVLAFPFWPEKGLEPGVFKPAGAIFPHDAADSDVVLSWQGGIDAVFFMELAGVRGQEPGGKRLPWNFDWPRFRRLFGDTVLKPEIRADPWLADWRGIAGKTVLSGFDRRRLVPEAAGKLEIGPGILPETGIWVGSSPFAPPLPAGPGQVFPVRGTPETWVCGEGILRADREAWIWLAHSP
ncbi:MAG: hypothetical protein FWD94_00385 [Treponema sp.]|nr:hypothetical protein [Treponema sp.]